MKIELGINDRIMDMIRQTSIAALNEQIAELTAARDTILNGLKKKPAHRSKLSASGRKSIAEAQRKRWAKQKRKARARKKKATPPA